MPRHLLTPAIARSSLVRAAVVALALAPLTIAGAAAQSKVTNEFVIDEWGIEKDLKKEKPAEEKSDKPPDPRTRDRSKFYRLAPMDVTVIRDGRAAGQVSLGITVEFGREMTKSDFMKQRTRLRDAFLIDLHGMMSMGGVFSVHIAKSRLLKAADRLLGAGKIKNIWIETVSTRELH